MFAEGCALSTTFWFTSYRLPIGDGTKRLAIRKLIVNLFNFFQGDGECAALASLATCCASIDIYSASLQAEMCANSNGCQRQWPF